MNKLKLFYIKLKQNKWINKYTITLLIFAIIIVFVDSSSLIDRYKAYREKLALKKEKAQYEESIKKDQEFLDAIQSDPEALEKFAREEYKMKGKNEDVYIISEEWGVRNEEWGMRNFCNKREQLSLLKLPSVAKILSKAKNEEWIIMNYELWIMN